ncbi:MAG: GAF domain-containing protein [Desulfobacterales bacterium]|nr:MAG: GAF domain-containing protein [Desulfobacterales bacterium]
MGEAAAKDVADLRNKIEELKIENERLAKFIEIGTAICEERDLDRLLPLVMANISKALKADRSTLFLIDWDRMTLWTKFAEGLNHGEIKIHLKMGLIGISVFTRQIVNVTNAYQDPRFNSTIDEATGYRTESVLSAPVFDLEKNVIGAVVLLNKKTGRFKKDDEEKALKMTPILAELVTAIDQDSNEIRSLLSKLRQSIQCERCSLFLLDKERGILFPLVAEGIEEHDIQLSLNLGIAGLVAITGEDLNIENAYDDPRFDERIDQKTGYRTRSILCVPIKDRSGEVIGVLEVINKKEGVFSRADKEILKALSSFVAVSVENAILFDEHNQQFRSILEVLAASIDAKDPLTAGHSLKVTKYAAGIARELGFAATEIEVLTVAALLHDYGKLGTSDNVLKKQGKLTPEEYDHIKDHVVNTRNILNKMYLMRQYRDVPLIASSHHERLDGSGYADGREAHQIPFMAKIIAVADVFEALTSKRYYHEACSPETAFEILNEEAGTKLDENIIQSLKQYWYNNYL